MPSANFIEIESDPFLHAETQLFSLSRSQHPINRRAANVQPLRDLSGAEPFGLEFFHRYLINGRLPALVHPLGLGLGDTFKLTLAPQVGFELGENAKHIEEALPGSRAGVDRLLRCSQTSRPWP